MTNPGVTDEQVERPFKVGDLVEKVGGRYGGPGQIVGETEDLDEDGYKLWNVAMKVEDGYGRFVHVFPSSVLRHREAALTPEPAGEVVAWRWRYDGETVWRVQKSRPVIFSDTILEPLYTHPPADRDARDAALEEVAMWHDAQAAAMDFEVKTKWSWVGPGNRAEECEAKAAHHRESATAIRAAKEAGRDPT